ncbi:MAG TPA: prepilin peptidase [Solimonas sp.]|nr:prepilin peptidase [Solimonas sp.]
MMVLPAILAAWALGIGAYDLWRQRIPNVVLLLCLVPAVLALVVNGSGLLQVAAGSSVGGLALALGVLLPGYSTGKMGAGDVKFAACLGLLLGFGRTVEMLLFAGVAMGILGLLWLKAMAADKKTRFPAGSAFALAFCAEMLAGPFLPALEDWP